MDNLYSTIEENNRKLKIIQEDIIALKKDILIKPNNPNDVIQIYFGVNRLNDTLKVVNIIKNSTNSIIKFFDPFDDYIIPQFQFEVWIKIIENRNHFSHILTTEYLKSDRVIELWDLDYKEIFNTLDKLIDKLIICQITLIPKLFNNRYNSIPDVFVQDFYVYRVLDLNNNDINIQKHTLALTKDNLLVTVNTSIPLSFINNNNEVYKWVEDKYPEIFL